VTHLVEVGGDTLESILVRISEGCDRALSHPQTTQAQKSYIEGIQEMTDTLITANKQPGNKTCVTPIGGKLPNGATLLARRTKDASREIVLALNGDEFVTWSVFHGDDESTSHGHYFADNLTAAAKDFEER
tara:strand:+ start:10452 stop:10844 length:393 start_codon:yes stop_codon:yes gene_type:complete